MLFVVPSSTVQNPDEKMLMRIKLFQGLSRLPPLVLLRSLKWVGVFMCFLMMRDSISQQHPGAMSKMHVVAPLHEVVSRDLERHQQQITPL